MSEKQYVRGFRSYEGDHGLGRRRGSRPGGRPIWVVRAYSGKKNISISPCPAASVEEPGGCRNACPGRLARQPQGRRAGGLAYGSGGLCVRSYRPAQHLDRSRPRDRARLSKQKACVNRLSRRIGRKGPREIGSGQPPWFRQLDRDSSWALSDPHKTHRMKAAAAFGATARNRPHLARPRGLCGAPPFCHLSSSRSDHGRGRYRMHSTAQAGLHVSATSSHQRSRIFFRRGPKHAKFTRTARKPTPAIGGTDHRAETPDLLRRRRGAACKGWLGLRPPKAIKLCWPTTGGRVRPP